MGAGGERQCSLGLELGEGTFKAASRLMGPWTCVYRKAGCFPFNSFFFSPLSLLCFEGVHLILIFSQGTGGLLKALCTYLYNVQMELRGVIIMKSLIVLIYYQ